MLTGLKDTLSNVSAVLTFRKWQKETLESKDKFSWESCVNSLTFPHTFAGIKS